MDREQIKNFRDRTDDVNGWFAATDFVMFSLLLRSQPKQGIYGDILEIGCYEGKSSIALALSLNENEQLHVCDLFSGSTDSRNMYENAIAYPGLIQKTFEENLEKHAGINPIIHPCDSAELPARLPDHQFRFIHVDGSHLYENVSQDLEFAASAAIASGGVIAVDDFRTPHTVGVAVAVWEKVLQSALYPLAMTANKIYLTPPGRGLDIAGITDELDDLEISYVFEEVRGFSVLRIRPTKDVAIYGSPRLAITRRSFIPPLVLDLRRIYLGRRRR